MGDQDKSSHLAMIQGVIDRMGGNSGLAKASAVGVVAGLAALASTAGPWPLYIALVAVVVLGWLDASYLRLERLFRHLYDAVRKDDPRVRVDGPYSMSLKPWLEPGAAPNVGWLAVVRSWSVWPFYALLALTAVVGAIVLLLQ
jgi:hypothetical protein